MSVHGANRLGTNTLVDLVVFGRGPGGRWPRTSSGTFADLPADPEAPVRAEIDGTPVVPGTETPVRIRNEMRT